MATMTLRWGWIKVVNAVHNKLRRDGRLLSLLILVCRFPKPILSYTPLTRTFVLLYEIHSFLSYIYLSVQFNENICIYLFGSSMKVFSWHAVTIAVISGSNDSTGALVW